VFGQLSAPTFGQGWRRWVFLAILFAAGTAIALARTPIHSWNILWAEDGTVFLKGALQGDPGIVFQAYAGYMHLVPRTLVGLSLLFPLPIVPTVMTILSAAVAGAVGCACFVFLETRISSVTVRFAIWVIAIALPVMGGEVANNVANLHWYLLIGAFCAVFVRSRSVPFVVAQSLVVFTAITSDALALILVPLLIFRWFVYPDRRDRWLSVVGAVASVIQVIVVMVAMTSSHARQFSATLPTPGQFLEFYSYRVIQAGLFGVTGTVRLAGSTYSVIVPGIVIVLALAAIIAAMIAVPSRAVLIGALAVSSVVFALLVFGLQWDGLWGVGPLSFSAGERYSVVPVALLMFALLTAADLWVMSRRRRWAHGVAAALVLAAVLAPTVVDYRAVDIRAGVPTFQESLRRGANACTTDPGGSVQAPVAPSWFGSVTVPCDRLDR
jgi:hypothetical protein